MNFDKELLFIYDLPYSKPPPPDICISEWSDETHSTGMQQNDLILIQYYQIYYTKFAK